MAETIDNPHNCCGMDLVCCEGATLPDATTASITAPDCSCLNGLSIPLAGGGDGWRGHKDNVCNGHRVEVVVICQTVDEITGFAVDLICAGETATLFPAPTDCGPDPAFRIEAALDGGELATCCGAGSGEITVVIE